MTTRAERDFILEVMRLEKELHEFAEDCIREIFGVDSKIALAHFNEGYSAYEGNGWLPSIACLKNQIERRTTPEK